MLAWVGARAVSFGLLAHACAKAAPAARVRSHGFGGAGLATTEPAWQSGSAVARRPELRVRKRCHRVLNLDRLLSRVIRPVDQLTAWTRELAAVSLQPKGQRVMADAMSIFLRAHVDDADRSLDRGQLTDSQLPFRAEIDALGTRYLITQLDIEMLGFEEGIVG